MNITKIFLLNKFEIYLKQAFGVLYRSIDYIRTSMLLTCFNNIEQKSDLTVINSDIPPPFITLFPQFQNY